MQVASAIDRNEWAVSRTRMGGVKDVWRCICVVFVVICCGCKPGCGIVLVSILVVSVVAVSPICLGMLLVEIVRRISPIAVSC
ncbi:MAG: hypothetical protein U7126_19855 [Microcoleus sp.]